MALPLGKLALVVGAGLVGSVLANDGGTKTVKDVIGGACKILYGTLKLDGSKSTSSKPRNDSLMKQVNSLRQELQLLASNRSVTIVSGDRSGSGKYGVVVIVVVVGYGYIWWKGWKLSDMMFATRSGLNDACSSVAKQLETVYSSVSATKRDLSSRVDGADNKIEEFAAISAEIQDEVSELRSGVKLTGAEVESVQRVVQTLESRFSRMDQRQNETNFGVGKLLSVAKYLENDIIVEQIESTASSSSRPALELPPVVTPSRTVSLPVIPALESPSPSTANGTQRRHGPSKSLQSKVSASGFKELNGISEDIGVSSLTSPQGSNVESKETNSDDSSTSGGLLRKFSGFGSSIVTRIPSFK